MNTSRDHQGIRFPTTSSRRGSILIVALLVAALIALVLGSYLSLNLGTARLAQRTFDRGAAFHLAEAGLEEGLWTYNRLLADQDDAWSDWQTTGDAAWRRIENFTLAATTTGEIKIYASPINPTANANPVVVALAMVKSSGGAPVTQMIETTLRRRSFFASGLVAREKLVFRGRNTTFDSWNSDPDGDPATPPIPYSKAIATDDGSVAIGALNNANAALNSAQIHGYVHTSGLIPEIGTDGFIGPFGVKEGQIDATRFSQNFHADFPVITAPEGGDWIEKFEATLGTLGQDTSWRATELHLKGKDRLTILGHVTLVLTSTTDALSLGSQAEINIPYGSSLTVYTSGDVSVNGNGILNENAAPAAFQIWSTATSERIQLIAIRGRGALSAVLYAPEADLTVNGNGSISGSIIARRVTFTGNAAFHYDHALASLNRHAPFRAGTWRTVDSPEARSRLLPLVDR